MTEPEESLHRNPAPRLWSDILANAFPVLGCLGWIGLLPLLDGYDHSERMARFFAALVNMIVIGVIGGPSTVLCLLGWRWSLRTETRERFRASRLGRYAAFAGLAVGTLVLLRHAPMVVWYLR